MEAADVRSYCESLRQDLTGWKAKIYDLVRALDKMPLKKNKIEHSLNGLGMLQASFCQLRTVEPDQDLLVHIDDLLRSKIDTTLEADLSQPCQCSGPGVGQQFTFRKSP